MEVHGNLHHSSSGETLQLSDMLDAAPNSSERSTPACTLQVLLAQSSWKLTMIISILGKLAETFEFYLGLEGFINGLPGN